MASPRATPFEFHAFESELEPIAENAESAQFTAADLEEARQQAALETEERLRAEYASKLESEIKALQYAIQHAEVSIAGAIEERSAHAYEISRNTVLQIQACASLSNPTATAFSLLDKYLNSLARKPSAVLEIGTKTPSAELAGAIDKAGAKISIATNKSLACGEARLIWEFGSIEVSNAKITNEIKKTFERAVASQSSGLTRTAS